MFCTAGMSVFFTLLMFAFTLPDWGLFAVPVPYKSVLTVFTAFWAAVAVLDTAGTVVSFSVTKFFFKLPSAGCVAVPFDPYSSVFTALTLPIVEFADGFDAVPSP